MKKPFEVLTRFVLILAFLSNAVVPSLDVLATNQAQSIPEAVITQKAIERTLPQETLAYYQPPVTNQINQPIQQNMAASDSKIRKRPNFSITASPNVVKFNDVITITATISNPGLISIKNIQFEDALGNAFEYVPDSNSVVTYDAQKGLISYSIDYLEAQSTVAFEYKLKVVAQKAKTNRGKVLVHSAQVSFGNRTKQKSQVAIGVGTELANAEGTLAVVASTGGWHDLGKVAVYLKKNAVDANAVLVASPRQVVKGRGPEVQFDLDVLSTSALSFDAKGMAVDQAAELVSAS